MEKKTGAAFLGLVLAASFITLFIIYTISPNGAVRIWCAAGFALIAVAGVAVFVIMKLKSKRPNGPHYLKGGKDVRTIIF